MEGWQLVGLKTAIIAMNGGDVTRDEIYQALKRRIAVVLIEGSGRETDAFIKAFRDDDFSATAGEMRCDAVAVFNGNQARAGDDGVHVQRPHAGQQDPVQIGAVDVAGLGEAEVFWRGVVETPGQKFAGGKMHEGDIRHRQGGRQQFFP